MWLRCYELAWPEEEKEEDDREEERSIMSAVPLLTTIPRTLIQGQG
jgi:hypothetical protein